MRLRKEKEGKPYLSHEHQANAFFVSAMAISIVSLASALPSPSSSLIPPPVHVERKKQHDRNIPHLDLALQQALLDVGHRVQNLGPERARIGGRRGGPRRGLLLRPGQRCCVRLVRGRGDGRDGVDGCRVERLGGGVGADGAGGDARGMGEAARHAVASGDGDDRGAARARRRRGVSRHRRHRGAADSHLDGARRRGRFPRARGRRDDDAEGRHLKERKENKREENALSRKKN